MSGHERMGGRASLRLGPGFVVERAVATRDHRQDRPGRALAADVEDAPHLVHAVDLPQPPDEGVEGGQRLGGEDLARPGGGPHDAVAVGRPEHGRHLVHELEVATGVADERAEIVVDPQP
jgi:hypothetical protein